MKPHPHFTRLIKRATQAPEERYGEIKSYNPSMWQKAKDWHYNKTTPGMLGPNQSSYNTLLNIGTSPVATAAIGGGLSTAGKAVSAARPALGAVASTVGNLVNPTVNLVGGAAQKGYTAAKHQFSSPAVPAPAPVAQTQGPESQINFQAMLPFLMAIMPQLFGGASGQGGQFAPETSLDRLARRNPYA